MELWPNHTGTQVPAPITRSRRLEASSTVDGVLFFQHALRPPRLSRLLSAENGAASHWLVLGRAGASSTLRPAADIVPAPAVGAVSRWHQCADHGLPAAGTTSGTAAAAHGRSSTTMRARPWTAPRRCARAAFHTATEWCAPVLHSARVGLATASRSISERQLLSRRAPGRAKVSRCVRSAAEAYGWCKGGAPRSCRCAAERADDAPAGLLWAGGAHRHGLARAAGAVSAAAADDHSLQPHHHSVKPRDSAAVGRRHTAPHWAAAAASHNPSTRRAVAVHSMDGSWYTAPRLVPDCRQMLHRWATSWNASRRCRLQTRPVVAEGEDGGLRNS